MSCQLRATRRTALRMTLACLLAPLTCEAADTLPAAGAKPREPRMVDWEELLPEKERRGAAVPASPAHDYLGEDGPAMRQYGSFATVSRFNGMYVKVPGFVVPLTMSALGHVGEFLLVPYFGACIHVPPPPPNQIVYVKLDRPVKVKTIFEPYWVSGVLTTAKKDTRMASAAYSIAGDRLELYKY